MLANFLITTIKQLLTAHGSFFTSCLHEQTRRGAFLALCYICNVIFIWIDEPWVSVKIHQRNYFEFEKILKIKASVLV